MKLKLFTVLLCMFASLSAGAQLFSPNVTQTIGTGSNISYFVINFDDGPGFTNNPASDFVFGYRWNYGAGNVAPTGDDMIQALTAPGTGVGLQAVETNFGSFGNLVDSFSYGPYSQTGNYSLNESYWSYWLTTGSRLENNISDWDSSSVGVSSRALAPDSYDGWTFSTFGDTVLPATPTTPEPSACLLFATGSGGLLALARKRARKTGHVTRNEC